MSYCIYNDKSGIVFGVYEGASIAEALDAMACEAGYADQAEMDDVSSNDGVVAVEVAGVDQVWSAEATIYELADGRAMVERGPERDIHADKSTALEALARVRVIIGS